MCSRSTGDRPPPTFLGAPPAARAARPRRRHWSTTPSYTDGEALWERVVDLGLEGVVAKKRSGHYLPGRRGWIKTKNRDYWRYPLEVEAAVRG
jgi:ATP-dependent DNA ligase